VQLKNGESEWIVSNRKKSRKIKVVNFELNKKRSNYLFECWWDCTSRRKIKTQIKFVIAFVFGGCV